MTDTGDRLYDGKMRLSDDQLYRHSVEQSMFCKRFAFLRGQCTDHPERVSGWQRFRLGSSDPAEWERLSVGAGGVKLQLRGFRRKVVSGITLRLSGPWWAPGAITFILAVAYSVIGV